MITVRYNDMGLTDYLRCWKYQQELFDGLLGGKNGGLGSDVPNAAQTLILCEHPHVYTLGRSGNRGNMLISDDFLEKIGATYCHVDRGGDITYHGPGQLVGYPILDLERLGLGLKEYIGLLEECIIRTIGDYGIEGHRSEGATGVWLSPADDKPLRKIAAIGVRSSRFITMHGFSLNVDPSMEYFNYINPCGFTDRGVTSMAAETGAAPDMAEVKRRFAAHFEQVFGVRAEPYEEEDIKVK